MDEFPTLRTQLQKITKKEPEPEPEPEPEMQPRCLTPPKRRPGPLDRHEPAEIDAPSVIDARRATRARPKGDAGAGTGAAARERGEAPGGDDGRGQLAQCLANQARMQEDMARLLKQVALLTSHVLPPSAVLPPARPRARSPTKLRSPKRRTA